MNWKLIIGLSICGVIMGFAAILGLPSKLEPFAWLPLFLLSAWLIARNTDKRHFLHGFLTGLANCAWNTLIHVWFSERYLAKHPVEAAQFLKMHAQSGATTIQSIVITSIVAGLMSAVVLGVFASMAAGFLKKIA